MPDKQIPEEIIIKGKYTTLHRIETETGEWVFHLHDECIICRKRNPVGMTMRYPSKYDDGFVCEFCVKDFLDDAIEQGTELVRRIRNDKNEPTIPLDEAFK